MAFIKYGLRARYSARNNFSQPSPYSADLCFTLQREKLGLER